MQIKTIPFTSTLTGAAANSYEWHIGMPNTDPTKDSNKLTLTDGIGGSTTSNPYFVNSFGLPQNKAGQQINPVTTENQYSVRVFDETGGLVYSEAVVSSDTVGDESSVVDGVFNNFSAAQNADLTDFETIFIESLLPGWEDTIAGPADGFYAHKDGTSGTPSSGTPAGFFDSAGEGWREDSFQRVEDTTIATIESDVSDNTAAIAAINAVATSVTSFVSSGTFNTPGNAIAIEIIVRGAGGGGNGVTATNRGGGGGGEGGESRTFINSPDSSYSVTVGSGGAPGVSSGSAGGPSSFGAVCAATGGAGGLLGGGGGGGLISGAVGDVLFAGAPGGNAGNPELSGTAFVFGGNGGGQGGASPITAARTNSSGGGRGASESGGGGSGTSGADGVVFVIIYT